MLTAQDTLDRNFLEIRARVLTVAAALDRIDRAPEVEHVRGDARLAKIREALAVAAGPEPGRAERVHMLFSDPYDPKWSRPERPRR
jgi:hypothetical protein